MNQGSADTNKVRRKEGDEYKVEGFQVNFRKVNRVLLRTQDIESFADDSHDRDEGSKDGVLEYTPLESVNEVGFRSTAGEKTVGQS